MSRIDRTKYCPICGKKFKYKRQSKRYCSDACRLAKHRGSPHFLDARIADFFRSVHNLEDAIIQKKFRLDEDEWRQLNEALATLNLIADEPFQKILPMGKEG